MATRRDLDDAELLAELRRMMPRLRGLLDDADYRQRRDEVVDRFFSRGRVVLVTMIAVGMFALQAVTLWRTSSEQHTTIIQKVHTP